MNDYIPDIIPMSSDQKGSSDAVSLSLSSNILLKDGDWLDKAIYPQPSVDDSLAPSKVEVMASLNLFFSVI